MKYNDMTEGMATLKVNFVCIFFLIMYLPILTFIFNKHIQSKILNFHKNHFHEKKEQKST